MYRNGQILHGFFITEIESFILYLYTSEEIYVKAHLHIHLSQGLEGQVIWQCC